MLDYRINTFLVLYDEMNYRKTAEKLNMTQPGVTQHIQYLENYYGGKLFEYNGKVLKKTKLAEHLKKHVDGTKISEKKLVDNLNGDKKTVINVGATKTIGEFVIGPVIKNFLGNPDNVINLYVDNTTNLLRMLEKSSLDFALIEGVFDKDKYAHKLYKKESFVGICSKKHRFAGKTVTMEDLFNQEIVVREEGSGTRNLLEKAIGERGYGLEKFKKVITVSNFTLICDIVASSGFITFAYEPVAGSRKDISIFDIEDISIKGEFNYVYCNEEIGKEKIKIFEGE